ncbi:MAG TPA: PASTA domain-containing protein, partial [Bacteroidia bacterium]|nr:PASTA domain-containing protein [Bacteroidia bacterium]
MKKFFSFFKSRAFFINLGIAVILLPLLFWIIFAWMASYTRHGDFVVVPDFTNLKINQLNSFVDDKSVSYEIIDSIWDPKLQKGLVLRQMPAPGAKVKQGRKVYLYVTATHAPEIAMPKLVDLSMRQAMAVCESYGLKAEFRSIDDPCDGCILKQEYKKKPINPGDP